MRTLTVVSLIALASCASPRSPAAPSNVVEEEAKAEAPAPAIAAPAEPPLPEIPDTPAPAPASLFAVVGIADPSATLASVAVYADAVQPGLGAMMTTQLVDALVAEVYGVMPAGVDYSKPMWALVLDPAVSDSPLLLVLAISDRDVFDAAIEGSSVRAVHHRGYAAMGPRAVIDEAAPHALSSVVLGAPPALPTATVDVAAVMDRYGAQLASTLALASASIAGQSPRGADSVRQILQGMVSLVQQTESITITLDTTADLSVVAELAPRKDASIAGIFASQPEASFAALAEHEEAGMRFGGKLDWESLREVMKPFTDAAMAEQWGEAGNPMQAAWAEMMPLMTGEMGFAMRFGAGGTTWMTNSFGISDAKKVREIQARAAKVADAASAKGAGPFELKSRKFTYKRVAVIGTTMKPRDSAPQETRDGFVAAFGTQPVETLSAVVDKTALMAMGEDADRRIKAGIDRAKAKKPAKPSATLAAAIAAARDRKESVLALIDVGSFTGGAPSGTAPVAIGLGFSGGRLSLRVAVPADQVRQMVQMASTPPTP
jgi:hypothetical protein